MKEIKLNPNCTHYTIIQGKSVYGSCNSLVKEIQESGLLGYRIHPIEESPIFDLI